MRPSQKYLALNEEVPGSGSGKKYLVRQSRMVPIARNSSTTCELEMRDARTRSKRGSGCIIKVWFP